MMIVVTLVSLSLQAQNRVDQALIAPGALHPVPANISKDILVSRGFGFDDRERPMCEINGPEGACHIEAFVWGEKSGSDEAAYRCSKLDRASYIGHCVKGNLDGLSLVIADGTTKQAKEAFLSYFLDGRIAFPALTSYLTGNPNFNLREKAAGYGCVYFGNWDASAARCGRFTQIYGADIFTESNARKLRDGSFDLGYYRAKFLDFVSGNGAAQASLPGQDDVAMQAMKDELGRSMSQMQLQKMEKPYFLAYRLDDIQRTTVSAMLGSVTEEQPSHIRMAGVEVRVGDYVLDNSNYVSLRNLSGGGGMLGGLRQAPLDDRYGQIRSTFWLATDGQYKKALEDLSAKRAALEMRKQTDSVADFSKEAPNTETELPDAAQVDLQQLKAIARAISAVFKTTPDIYGSSVELEYRELYTRYINSEGSSFTRAQPIFKLQIKAQTQSTTGVPISDSIELHGRTFADIPRQDVLIARTQAMADRILKLRTASSLDRYNGPVLFEDQAAGEIFAQQFATGLVATRMPLSDDPRFEMFFNQMMGQLGGASFVDKIGGRVLPDFLSVSDNPLVTDYKGMRLLGARKIDDDAVMTRETKLVEHGILKTLLSTRVPLRSVPHSTGSRRGWGPAPSNLFVTSEKSLTTDELRRELLRRVKDRGLEYGIVVRRVGGGAAASFIKMATRMAQQGGQGATSLAEVYKVFPDGREEPVQGVEVADMTPAAFRDIVAVGDTPVVFSDDFIPRIGALFSMAPSSSDMPLVSCVVPALLFDEVSLVKSQGPFPNPPVSPSPLAIGLRDTKR